MIEARDLSLAIGGAHILRDISLSLPTGKLTALIGPNGAGKSTLLSLFGRLLTPDAGAVLLDGAPLADIPSPVLARRLSVLRQSSHIAPRLTVRDLVGFGRYPHCHGRLGPADHRIVEGAIARLDLSDLADRYLDTLSGGQRQRALIAMVLAQDTEVLLLDEPLNNLDLAHARVVMRLAREEAAQGKTVAVVLHDISVAAAHADHLVALKDGRLFAEGAPEQIVTRPVLSQLYDTPVEVLETDRHRVVMAV